MVNIRIYLNLLLLAFLVNLVLSCNDEDAMFRDDTYVRLTLRLDGQASMGTRTSDAGDGSLNENLINSVDLFFYSKGSTETVEPIYYVERVEIPANTEIFRGEIRSQMAVMPRAKTACVVSSPMSTGLLEPNSSRRRIVPLRSAKANSVLVPPPSIPK